MAKPYQEGKGWCVRKRFKNHDIFLSGHDTKGAVEKALRAEIKAIERSGKPQHLGPHRSTLAYALQDYGLPDGHPNSPTYGHLKLPHLN